MTIPRPGKAVRGSKTGVPVMALFDLMGRSWAMGVIWQLRNGPFTFRELQSRCESITPSILNSRLKDLREAAIVERTLDGYRLTERGTALFELLLPFKGWAHSWAYEVFDYKMPSDS